MHRCKPRSTFVFCNESHRGSRWWLASRQSVLSIYYFYLSLYPFLFSKFHRVGACVVFTFLSYFHHRRPGQPIVGYPPKFPQVIEISQILSVIWPANATQFLTNSPSSVTSRLVAFPSSVRHGKHKNSSAFATYAEHAKAESAKRARFSRIVIGPSFPSQSNGSWVTDSVSYHASPLG